MPEFKHYDLQLVQPEFAHSLTDLIIELDALRNRALYGTTNAKVFFQLKNIFHTLESIGSARIEGNNTTIAEYIETKLETSNNVPLSIKEIQNIEKAMVFIEANVKNNNIDRAFVSEMHKMVVDGLPPAPNGEGDRTPGLYRTTNIKIGKSEHLPPDHITIEEYMHELFDFINKPDGAKYDLLKAAIAHHRFVWIHPFNNGNGRTVRLFTYAMIVKTGFNVNVGRIINPTAVFCSNRNDYYKMLSMADSGDRDGILSWSEYVLKGLKEEIEKIDKLLNYEFLKKEILTPSLHHSLERKYITDNEYRILKRVIEKQTIKAGDIKDLFEGKVSAEISRQIKRLFDKNMLSLAQGQTRAYVINFQNNFMLRSVIKTLGDKGFLPAND